MGEKEQEKFSKAGKVAKIRFRNKDLLKQAFIHRSYLNENPQSRLGNNERLEFLGWCCFGVGGDRIFVRMLPDEAGGAPDQLESGIGWIQKQFRRGFATWL